MMAQRMMTFFSALLFCLLTGLNGSAADRVAELLPEFTLPLPEQAEHRAYLGIEDLKGDSFTVADIQADVVLIELFSMYCPYCQEEAPLINELYDDEGFAGSGSTPQNHRHRRLQFGI